MAGRAPSLPAGRGGGVFSDSVGLQFSLGVSPHSFPLCFSAPQITQSPSSSALLSGGASKPHPAFLTLLPLVGPRRASPRLTTVLLPLSKRTWSPSLNFFPQLPFLSVLALITSLHHPEIVVCEHFFIKLALLKLHSFRQQQIFLEPLLWDE